MTLARRILYLIVVPLAHTLVRFWWRMCPIVHIEGQRHLHTALAQNPSLILCHWHQHQLFCGKYLLGYRARALELAWLISPSVDGEIGARLVQRLGGHAIRGSSTRSGTEAFLSCHHALTKQNHSLVITPDGPSGPRHKVKPGAILLARKSGRPILPIACAATRAWCLGWDRFLLPKPFARIAIAIGPPIHIPRTIDAANTRHLQRELETELTRLSDLAAQVP